MSKVENSSKHKIQKECAFLYFLANNPHKKQIIYFLKYLLLPQQYTVIRELAVNDLADYLPEYTSKKKRSKLKLKLKNKINKLAKGDLHPEDIHRLYEIIPVWAADAIKYHELCKETRTDTL